MSSEKAAVYASLILHDAQVDLTEDNLVAVASAAGVELEPIYAKIFAKALNGKDLSNLLGALQVGAVGGGQAAAAPAAAAGGDAKEEKKGKKEEKPAEEEEEDDEMGFGLFD